MPSASLLLLQRSNRALAAENKRLKETNQHLREDVEHLKRLIFDEGIPARVREWMREYDLPIWEVFYCHEHKEWFNELDSAFPYDFAGCTCKRC